MKKLLTWPAPLLQKWLLSLLLCLPFLAAAIVSAFSGDRTFLILSALLLLFCGVASPSRESFGLIKEFLLNMKTSSYLSREAGSR